MVSKLGSVHHAMGFVIHKLYEQHRFGGKHIAVEDLVTGYPQLHRGLIKVAVDELRKKGIISIQKKRTRRGSGDHATLVWEQLGNARGLLNGYRVSVDLPRLGRDLKTLLPVKR